jgi:hypothetical protein
MDTEVVVMPLLREPEIKSVQFPFTAVVAVQKCQVTQPD